MSGLCTRELDTHAWMLRERVMLSPFDCDGFYSVFLSWACSRCQRRVWADGVLHQTTPALSPVGWEAITLDRANPWQQQVEVLHRETQQREYVQARIADATLTARRR